MRFFWKAIAEHLGVDSPAIRFTSLRSVLAIVRFELHCHSSYLGLQEAKSLPETDILLIWKK